MDQLLNAVQKVINNGPNGSKVETGELVFEFQEVKQQPDLTSAIFTQFNFDASDEFSFARFLSSEFISKPFVLVSKMRPGSVSDEISRQSESSSVSVKSSVSSHTQRMKTESTSPKDAAVWGSPLKCDFPVDESIDSLNLDTSQIPVDRKKPKPKHLGIPLNLTRKIISAYNTNRNKISFNTDLPPLVVLCNGEDRHSTALMGVDLFQVTKETRVGKGFKIMTVEVSKNGETDSPKTTIKMGGGLAQSCQAVYQVNADIGKQGGSNVVVDITWKGANSFLENPPLAASTQVKASVQPGTTPSCQNLYQELQFLERIMAALTSGEVEWISPSGVQAQVPLTAAVRALLETLQEEGTLGSLEEQAEGEVETQALEGLSIPERKDYDFTDRLWKVMVQCMTTADLLSAWRLVFAALGKGQLRPFVDRHNTTTVAQMVRDAFTGRFSPPSLMGIQPFQFLAEIGAEKLRKDYMHFLVSRSLATVLSLEDLMGVDLELEDKLGRLSKVHCVLEMMEMLASLLRLQDHSLATIARHMLGYYATAPADPRHVFTFPVKTSEVRYVISSLQPALWCLDSACEVPVAEGVYERSLHCFSLTPPLLHLQSEALDNGVDKLDNGADVSKLVERKSNYYVLHRKESVVVL